MNIDWSKIFALETPLLEIFIRGTVMYLGLLILARFFLKRQSGSGGISDVLVVVLLADAAQNAMADDYRSITDGVLLVSTILAWTFIVDWLGYHIKMFESFTYPSSLILVRDGKMLRRNMRKELITEAELMGQVRANGIDSLSDVKEARMEGDGEISVIKKQKD